MTKWNNPINGMNLFIMGNAFFPIVALVLAPLSALILSSVIWATAWAYCTGNDYSALPRAGTLITGVAFLYVLVEEAWDLTGDIGPEIEANFARLRADDLPEAQPALVRYRAITSVALRTHKVVVRVIEAALIVFGTILSAVGDLVAAHLAAAIGVH